MASAQRHMTEEQAVHLIRNSLIVAGQEMGADGDHWPVIKATALSIMKDYENSKIEHNTFEEVKKHFANMVRELEALCAAAPAEEKTVIRGTIIRLLEIYNATFSPISLDHLHVRKDDRPMHLHRAEEIIKTLEADNDV